MPVLKTIATGVEKLNEITTVARKGVEAVEKAKEAVEAAKYVGDAVKGKLENIKNLTPEQLMEKMDDKRYMGGNDNFSETNESDEGNETKEGLTDEEKTKIKEETGWPDEIIDVVDSIEEYGIYRDAGLQEAEIGGKECLIRSDIDWDQKDAMGRTNKERAEQGLSPINEGGKVIELHHIGQHSDSPLAELTPEEHRGKGNDTILHNKTKESEINRQAFAGERSAHWEARANKGGNS